MKTIVLKYKGVLLKEDNAELDAFYTMLHKYVKFGSIEDTKKKWMRQKTQMREHIPYINEEEIVGSLLHKITGKDVEGKEVRTLFRLYQTYMMYGPIYQNAIHFIEEGKVPVCVYTDAPLDYAHINLKRNNVHVNGIYSSENALHHTHSKEFYNWLKDQIQNDILVVTDDEVEGLAAIEAGLDAVLMRRNRLIEKSQLRVVKDCGDLIAYAK